MVLCCHFFFFFFSEGTGFTWRALSKHTLPDLFSFFVFGGTLRPSVKDKSHVTRNIQLCPTNEENWLTDL